MPATFRFCIFFPFPVAFPVTLGLRAEKEEEAGVGAEATPGEESREEGVKDLSAKEAVEESRSLEGNLD